MAASLVPPTQQSREIRTESHGEQLPQSRGDTAANLANGVEWQPETPSNSHSLNDQINNCTPFFPGALWCRVLTTLSDEIFMEDAQFSANIFDFLVNGGSMLESTDLSGAGSSPPGDRAAEQLSTERASVIPTERFAKVARLWPHRMGPNAATRLEANLWKEVVAFGAANICTDPSSDPSNCVASGCDLAVDEDQRLALIREFAPGRGGKRKSNGSEVPSVTFPSTRLLNLGLGLAFRHPHLPLSFIHQPTFSIKRAPKSIAFALCLLGLGLLDCKQARDFTKAYFTVSMRCMASRMMVLNSNTDSRGQMLRPAIPDNLGSGPCPETPHQRHLGYDSLDRLAYAHCSRSYCTSSPPPCRIWSETQIVFLGPSRSTTSSGIIQSDTVGGLQSPRKRGPAC